MNEAARNMKEFDDVPMHNPALENAMRRVAQGLGGNKDLTPESIKDLFRSRGIIGESQEELGKEIGGITADEIERIRNSGIMNSMSSENPPQNPTEQGNVSKQQGNEFSLETTENIDPKSLREEIARLDLERSKIINETRYREPTEEERVALNNTTERMVALKDKLSSLPPEEHMVIASNAESEDVVTQKPETPATESMVFVQEKNGAAIETLDKSPREESLSAVTTVEQIQKEIKNLNQQEIDNAQDVEIPSIKAHMYAEINAVTPDSAVHVKATGEIVPNPFEKAITKIKSEDPARAERLLAAISASPEQKERIEKLLGATETQAQKVEQEIKEKDHWVVERALKIGEWYRRLPLKYKLAASAIFVGTAGATAVLGGAGIGMVMGAAFVGSTGQRFLGSLATFATVEGILTKRSLARNEKEEKIMGMRTNVVLGALAASGVFLGGKLLGDYLSSHTGGVESGAGGKAAGQIKVPVPAPEHISNTEAQNIYEAAQKEIHRSIPLPNETVPETASSIMTPENEIVGHAADKMIETSYTVHGRDNLWNIIKEKIPEIQDLDGEGRQSNAIANIIEQIKKDPESFGISSDNVGSLSAGDTINLEKIRGVLETTTIPIEDGQSVGIIERASGLTDVEASHIMANNAKISAWHAANPDALLTTETVDKILSGGMDHAVTAQPDGLAEITKDYTLSIPDTGGRTIEQLSAEALAMDTDRVLHADVQTMFGSKGFFGYGFLGTNGERSVDWLDFKGRAVSEVMSKKFDAVPLGEEGAVQKFGIDSPGAVDKLKGYLKLLIDKSGMNPDQGENVEHFSKRAIGAIISKKQ